LITGASTLEDFVEASYSNEYEDSNYFDSMLLTDTQMIRNETIRSRETYAIAKEEVAQTKNLHYALEKYVFDNLYNYQNPFELVVYTRNMLGVHTFYPKPVIIEV
jgi:hypothetical protein